MQRAEWDAVVPTTSPPFSDLGDIGSRVDWPQNNRHGRCATSCPFCEGRGNATLARRVIVQAKGVAVQRWWSAWCRDRR